MAYGKTPAGLSSYETLAGDIAARIPGARTILDLACGDGYLLQALSRRFPDARLIGIDISPEELASARERLGTRADLQLANARALPLEDGACDAIACHMALMLMDDAESVITEAARVLRPSGVFAAILNGSHSTDPILGAFTKTLRDAERSEQLPPLSIGDPRIHKDDDLHTLFAEAFAQLEVQDFELNLTGTPDQVRAALLGFYNLHRLSTAANIDVRDRLDAQIASTKSQNGTVPLSLPMRRILATKR